MLIENKIRVPIKQQLSKSVHNIDVKIEHLSLEQKNTIRSVIHQFPTLFAAPDKKLTYTTTVVGEIRTSTESPIYTIYYPYPMSLKSEVEEQVNKLWRMFG